MEMFLRLFVMSVAFYEHGQGYYIRATKYNGGYGKSVA